MSHARQSRIPSIDRLRDRAVRLSLQIHDLKPRLRSKIREWIAYWKDQIKSFLYDPEDRKEIPYILDYVDNAEYYLNKVPDPFHRPGQSNNGSLDAKPMTIYQAYQKVKKRYDSVVERLVNAKAQIALHTTTRLARVEQDIIGSFLDGAHGSPISSPSDHDDNFNYILGTYV
jgi:hypothetical protein